MTRTDRVRRVEPARADGYAEVGRKLLQTARTMRELGDARHAPALAILAVHAAIAYADAATIHRGGRKSASADHSAALRVLKDVFGTRVPAPVAKAFARVVADKAKLEYQGYVVPMREADAIMTQAERVGAWVESVLAGAA